MVGGRNVLRTRMHPPKQREKASVHWKLSPQDIEGARMCSTGDKDKYQKTVTGASSTCCYCVAGHPQNSAASCFHSWKQPKYPSTEQWTKKMWYTYTMQYYSAIKRNEIGSFVEMRMDLKTVTQK